MYISQDIHTIARKFLFIILLCKFIQKWSYFTTFWSPINIFQNGTKHFLQICSSIRTGKWRGGDIENKNIKPRPIPMLNRYGALLFASPARCSPSFNFHYQSLFSDLICCPVRSTYISRFYCLSQNYSLFRCRAIPVQSKLECRLFSKLHRLNIGSWDSTVVVEKYGISFAVFRFWRKHGSIYLSRNVEMSNLNKIQIFLARLSKSLLSRILCQRDPSPDLTIILEKERT